ncbi:MAG TPA: SDR family oxidoreductase [Chloroflexota bacterium]
MTDSRLVLVSGATGYVGGRLIPRLLEAGHRVRVLVRDPDRLQGRPWLSSVEVATGDVLQPETLPAAVAGVSAAYYLIHGMSDTPSFERRDIEAARNFGKAAKAAGVERIIYLGPLGNPRSDLSTHLRSRRQTGAALREAGVPVTEFQAAIIVGSGSISFEIVRYLTERLPVMICPKWTHTRTQPIAIRDVLAYLIDALEVPESAGKTIQIGGADALSYAEMMICYARVRGLQRHQLLVPLLSSRLSSYWIHLTTPIPATIARPLIDGLRYETVVRDATAKELFPAIEPIDYETAVRLALVRLEKGDVETAWSGALVTSMGDVAPYTFSSEEGMLLEQRQQEVKAEPSTAFRIFSGLGGQRGWLYMDWTWMARGAMDRVVGGVGVRRGRRHPDELRVGEALDFWRVEAVEPNHLLRLRAEMKLPGKGWLQFEAVPEPNGRTRLIQTAYFVPKGLMGLAYWYLLYPIHSAIFSGMIREIARRAESAAGFAI